MFGFREKKLKKKLQHNQPVVNNNCRNDSEIIVFDQHGAKHIFVPPRPAKVYNPILEIEDTSVDEIMKKAEELSFAWKSVFDDDEITCVLEGIILYVRFSACIKKDDRNIQTAQKIMKKVIISGKFTFESSQFVHDDGSDFPEMQKKFFGLMSVHAETNEIVLKGFASV